MIRYHNIHQVWVGPEIPERFLKRSKKIESLNPEYSFFRWEEERLIEEFPEIKKFLDLECVPGFISNWARLRIINKYGGWYIDYDFEGFAPLEQLLKNSKCKTLDLIAIEAEFPDYEINNGFFYASKNFLERTPLLLEYLPDVPMMSLFNSVLKNYEKCVIPKNFVSTTGIYYKEERMRAFYLHKHFKYRLIPDNETEAGYRLIHKDTKEYEEYLEKK